MNLRSATAEAGGKAQALAQLLEAGFRVPEGFCVYAHSQDAEIVQAWRALQAPRVAVRSSSQQEDARTQSCAGHFETVLDVALEEELLLAVKRIRASLSGSVIVQVMVPARVAGVVFTRDPTTSEVCARVEAAPGRGDALVSGHVRPAAWRFYSPDRLQLLEGPACLSPTEVLTLLEVCGRIQALFESELDLEFAFGDDEQPWILQARPITASHDLREQLRQGEIARAAALAYPGGTCWSRHNLAETLPTPLPMSWSLVRRMLSLGGAYGRLYRDLGYDPDPCLHEEGVLDLICGRPYFNLSRGARLYFKDFPLVAPIQALRANPRLAAQAAPQVDLKQAGPGFWRRLPATLWKMVRAQYVLENARLTFAHRFTQQIAPAFVARMRTWSLENLADLEPETLRQRLERVVAAVVDDFAADSLKASAFAAQALARHGQQPLPAVRLLPEADQAGLMQRAARGQLSLAELLEAIGHRGPAEMEVAEPRWSEIPERLAQQVAAVRPRPESARVDHGELARWLSLRETARHWLMLGWAEIRRNLLALDRRLGLQGGIFWLHLEELCGPDLDKIAQRRQHHRLLLSIPCPVVLFSDDLEAIGRAPAPSAQGGGLRGTPLSWGSAEGPALVVGHVDEIPTEAQGYVLVCPSTDPGYTLAMTRCLALVVETGGVLSHGAIVARELGLPAVSNIPIHQLASGQRLRVDGQTGLVTPLPEDG
jgi:pyruvate,water dikinase